MHLKHKPGPAHAILLVLGLFVILLTSCTTEPPAPVPAATTRTVTDMAGRSMEVPLGISRVYVNRPAAVLMYAMAPDMLVNRSFRLTKAEQKYMLKSYVALPYVDGAPEEVMRLRPDIIISEFTINARTKDDADKLAAKTGIPVFMVPMDMGTYPETFTVLGDLLDRSEQAEQMKGFLATYLDPLVQQAASLSDSLKKRVYYAEGDNGLHTDPSGSFHSAVIDYVGGENVARVNAMPGKGMSPVSMEQLLLWNPDIILVWTGMGGKLTTMEHIMADPLWHQLRAVQEHDVHQIPFLPFSWFDRPPGVNRIIGSIWTADKLYPERFPFDLKRTTTEFYRIFYHCDLGDEQLEALLHPENRLLRQE